MRFAGRNEVADWCGEKLHEVQAARIIESAFTARRLTPSFAMLACDTSGDVPHYVLYVEAAASEDDLGGIAAAIDRALDENFHYRHARRLGQLGPLRAFAARNAEASYLAACMARGQRAGDVKHVALDRSRWLDAAVRRPLRRSPSGRLTGLSLANQYRRDRHEGTKTRK